MRDESRERTLHDSDIVCGIDQSPEARAATRLAAALTERLNGRLSLVHAVAASASSAMPTCRTPRRSATPPSGDPSTRRASG